jgi:hypothetical protein
VKDVLGKAEGLGLNLLITELSARGVFNNSPAQTPHLERVSELSVFRHTHYFSHFYRPRKHVYRECRKFQMGVAGFWCGFCEGNYQTSSLPIIPPKTHDSSHRSEVSSQTEV